MPFAPYSQEVKGTEQISSLLRQCREQSGMSMNKLASVARVSKAQLSRIERGKTGLTLKTFMRISDALELSFSDFLLARRREQGRIANWGDLTMAFHDLPEVQQEKVLRIFWSVLQEIDDICRSPLPSSSRKDDDVCSSLVEVAH